MKGRQTCSKCGLPGYATWEDDNTSKLTVICKSCISIDKKVIGDHSQYHGIARSQTFEINSPLQRMVLPNETSTTLHCDKQRSIKIQDQSYLEPNLKLSLSLPSGTETKYAHKGKSACLWDPKILQKRRRSKLPQYVLSPMERFANQLRQAKMCQDMEDVSENNGSRWLLHEKPKYDDNFIYEKCKLISDNEIGLGATLLAPHVPLAKCSRPEMGQAKKDPYSDGEAASCVLFDVPIRGFYA